MKKNTLSFYIVPMLIVLVSACTTTKAEKIGEASKDVQNSQEILDKANKQYIKEVSIYRESVESDLRNNKLKIAKLQDQKSQLKNEALIVRNEKIAAMQKCNDELELRMRQYRGDNTENWKVFRREFDSDMSALEKSLKELEKYNTK